MSEMRDPFQHATAPETEYLADDAVQQAANAAMQQQVGAVSSGPLTYVPDYGRLQMRMQCLSMAMGFPDGAMPPPLDVVIERATAYWAFVRGDP